MRLSLRTALVMVLFLGFAATALSEFPPWRIQPSKTVGGDVYELNGRLAKTIHVSPPKEQIAYNAIETCLTLIDKGILHDLCHEDGINDWSISPDYCRIVTAGDDHTSKVWKYPSCELLTILKHDRRVNKATFTADGNCIVTETIPGVKHLWCRRRPEEWWGIAWLWEFWLTIAMGGLLTWSIIQDIRYFRKLRQAKSISEAKIDPTPK